MKELHLYPPNFAKIRQVFNTRNRGVIFTYGNCIYNPEKIRIPPQLWVHEQVHRDQQKDDPESWWDKYLGDKLFRLAEEIQAHKAEYGVLNTRKALDEIASRLSSPLYGSLVSWQEAKRLIGG